MTTALAEEEASHEKRNQIIVAVIASALVTAPAYVLPQPFAPFAPIVLAFLPLAGLFAVSNPFLMCLGFVIFSFFRIHEAFPVLNPLHIPQLLAIPTLLVLCWHIFGKKQIVPYWRRELTIFAIFFTLVTLGLPFAANKPTAIGYWTATYIKIAIMTVAIAWLVRKPRDFALGARAFVLAGTLISAVTLYNKVNGIGLVEGTRVTIARDMQSVLGDPNDLSLVLLFPLSFAISLFVRRTGWLTALLGLVGAGMIISAIIATQSRGGLLGLMTVSGIIGSRVIKSKAVLASIGGVAAIGLFAVAGISSRSSGGAGEEGIDESSMGRIYAWGAAWQMALTHPLYGVGLDNFVPNYYAYSAHWDGNNHAVHSTWFGVLGETGFPGLITFVAMVIVTAYSAFRSVQKLDVPSSPPAVRAMSVAILGGIGGFCVSGTFLTQGFTWPIYVLVALTTAISQFAESEQANSRDAKPIAN